MRLYVLRADLEPEDEHYLVRDVELPEGAHVPASGEVVLCADAAETVEYLVTKRVTGYHFAGRGIGVTVYLFVALTGIVARQDTAATAEGTPVRGTAIRKRARRGKKEIEYVVQPE